MDNTSEIESRVIAMYERHPFPSITDKQRKADEEMELRLHLLGIKPEEFVGKKVLDGGCGTGEYSCWYASHGAEVTAIDLSEPSLRQASEYAQREGIKGIKFEKQSVLNLNFPDESFDFVYSMGVLHHTPDPYRGFQELCRVLRPGGVIIVSVYNKFGRFRHNMKQRIVRMLAGEDIDRRVMWAKRLFPRTCQSLKRNRREASDVILYDAFGIPHESQHSIGEVLVWFDRNEIDYLGAFGPVTLRDNLMASRRKEFQRFRQSFNGFPLSTWLSNMLPKLADWAAPDGTNGQVKFIRPSWFSRSWVQLGWFVLGFKFSIFSLSGRKIGRS